MADLPTLALARKICRNYMNDDFSLIIIYGPPRIGKSAYAIKVMGQVLDYLKGQDIYDPGVCQKYLGWDPRENVDRWLDIYKRIPVFTWDDAGYWLFSLNWTDPLLITVQQYMNVVGTDMNTLILTTPDPSWILSKIANMPGTIRVNIIKRDGGREFDSVRFARRAIAYKPWKYPDGKGGGVNKVLEDEFSCKLPDPFYSEWYKPIREKYAYDAKLAMKEELIRRSQAKQKKDKRFKKRGPGRPFKDEDEDE